MVLYDRSWSAFFRYLFLATWVHQWFLWSSDLLRSLQHLALVNRCIVLYRFSVNSCILCCRFSSESTEARRLQPFSTRVLREFEGACRLVDADPPPTLVGAEQQHPKIETINELSQLTSEFNATNDIGNSFEIHCVSVHNKFERNW